MTTEEALTIGSDAEMIKKKKDKGWAKRSVGSSQGPVIGQASHLGKRVSFERISCAENGSPV